METQLHLQKHHRTDSCSSECQTLLLFQFLLWHFEAVSSALRVSLRIHPPCSSFPGVKWEKKDNNEHQLGGRIFCISYNEIFRHTGCFKHENTHAQSEPCIVCVSQRVKNKIKLTFGHSQLTYIMHLILNLHAYTVGHNIAFKSLESESFMCDIIKFHPS